jgi:hypothetical protein
VSCRHIYDSKPAGSHIQTREARGRPLNVGIFDKTKSSSISVFLAHPSLEIHVSLISMLSKQLKGFGK